ncbi:hypothetical protein EV128_12422 [Rhizobium azibense]|nr:hypothetical protein EV128_12422 [Rhizobium azibense]
MLAAWEYYRATAWVYPNGGLSPRKTLPYAADGFDVGVHVNTGCNNVLPMEFAWILGRDLYAFRTRCPGLPPQRGSRTHCIARSDWVSTPKVEAHHGIRIDLSYYYWPGSRI